MRNLNAFVRKSGAALGGATGQPPPKPLSEADIRKIGEVVRDPTFHVYVGKDDDIIRRVAGKIEFDVPEESRQSLGGIESGSIEFEVEFAKVNGDQQIEAPANPRPLSALTSSLGGTGGLDGVVGGTGGGACPRSRTPTARAPRPRTSRSTRTASTRRVPEDTEALQRCAELLQRP